MQSCCGYRSPIPGRRVTTWMTPASHDALELVEEIALLALVSVANAKRALCLGAGSSLRAAFEVENMN